MKNEDVSTLQGRRTGRTPRSLRTGEPNHRTVNGRWVAPFSEFFARWPCIACCRKMVGTECLELRNCTIARRTFVSSQRVSQGDVRLEKKNEKNSCDSLHLITILHLIALILLSLVCEKADKLLLTSIWVFLSAVSPNEPTRSFGKFVLRLTKRSYVSWPHLKGYRGG